MVESKRQGIEDFLKGVTLITPEIFKNSMNEIFMSCKDPATSDAELDYAIFEGTSLMCAALRMTGYKEGVDIFEQLCRLTRRKDCNSGRDSCLKINEKGDTMDTASFETTINEIVYELKDAVNRLDIECSIIPDFSNSPDNYRN